MLLFLSDERTISMNAPLFSPAIVITLVLSLDNSNAAFLLPPFVALSLLI